MTRARSRRAVFGALFLSLLAVGQADAQDRVLQLTDLGQITDLSEPQISPDGRSVALVLSRANFRDNRYDDALAIVDVRTRQLSILTERFSTLRHPRWSPSGDRLAFLGSSGQGLQLYLQPIGADSSEVVTADRGGVRQFAWSPDGTRIAFVSPEGRPEGSAETAHNRSFVVGDHDYLATGPRAPLRLRVLSLIDASVADVPVRGSVTGDPIAWSPGGDRLVYVSQPEPYASSLDQRSIWVVDVQTGSHELLTPAPAFYEAPRLSPDGDRVGYLTPEGPGPIWTPHRLAISGSRDEIAVDAARQIDRSIWWFDWLGDDRSLLIGAYDRSTFSLWIQRTGERPIKLPLGDVVPSRGWSIPPDPGPRKGSAAFSISVGADGSIAFVGSEPNRPEELYYMRSMLEAPERLTDLHADFARITLGRVEPFRWRSDFDSELEGVVVYPPRYDPQRPYPLVLLLHGGPRLVTTRQFSFAAQLLAAQGWIVFGPNFRGSTNLGTDFQRSYLEHGDEGAATDVMAGLDALRSQVAIDERRLAVTGWSYGGLLSVWLAARETLWAAAVAGAPLTDYVDLYALSDRNRLWGHVLQASPFASGAYPDVLDRSPISRAHRIRTPMLILATTGDLVAPVSQSYKLYRALRDNEVPVEFVAYPVSGHYVADPVHQQDVLRRWVSWISTQFRGVAARGTQKP